MVSQSQPHKSTFATQGWGATGWVEAQEKSEERNQEKEVDVFQLEEHEGWGQGLLTERITPQPSEEEPMVEEESRAPLYLLTISPVPLYTLWNHFHFYFIAQLLCKSLGILHCLKEKKPTRCICIKTVFQGLLVWSPWDNSVIEMLKSRAINYL